jgi:hypothetical protein
MEDNGLCLSNLAMALVSIDLENVTKSRHFHLQGKVPRYTWLIVHNLCVFI